MATQAFRLLKNNSAALIQFAEYTRINNDKIWLKLQSVPMSDGKKNIIGGLGIIEDITQMIKSQQTIHQQAFF